MNKSILKDNLLSKTFTSSLWASSSQIIVQLLSIINMIILARLLSPSDFGLIAMVTVFSGISIVIAEMGLASAIIKKESISDRYLSTVFWLNLLLGVAFFVAFNLFTTSISNFYNEERLIAVCKIISLCFIINAFSMINRSLIVKELGFKKIAFVNIFSKFTSMIFTIYLAIVGYGFLSLAWQPVISSFISMFFFWYFARWKLILFFKFSLISKDILFGLKTLGNTMIDYSVRNIDKLLIGKIIGASSLGIYSRSQFLLQFGINGVVRSISSVFFPSFSKIKDDTSAIKKLYLKFLEAISIVFFPMITGLYVVADNFVFVLFGENWMEMSSIIRGLCLAIIITIATSMNSAIYLSQDRAGLQLIMSILTKSFIVISLIIGINWGIKGVAWAYSISTLAMYYPMMRFVGSLINLRFYEHINTIMFALISSICMSLSILFLSNIISKYLDPIWLLLAQISYGIVIYSIILFIFKKEFLQKLYVFLKTL